MASPLRIGWAHRDITPNRPVALRGQFNLRIATRTRDPLTLSALAIEGGGDQAIFVSVDTCGVDDLVLDESRRLLGARLPSFDPRKLIASATHTHTAPYVGSDGGLQDDVDYFDAIRARYLDYLPAREYGRMLIEALVSAACEAWEARSAGLIGWGYTHAVLGENRRVRYFDDRAEMYGRTDGPGFLHIEGHNDHAVNLLLTYSRDRELTGLVVNVACPSQASEGGQDYVSADYWHDARAALCSRFGSDVHVLAQCSAAGDQSPHRLIQTKAEERMLRLKHGDSTPEWSDNAALRRELARRITDAVSDAEPAIRKDLRDEVVLRNVPRALDLQHWNVTDAEYAALQAELGSLRAEFEALGDADPLGGAYSSLRSRIGWCQLAADRYLNPPASVPIKVNVVRLGDIAFVTAPFEYYLDFGDRIKGRSKALQTFIVQLAGGGSYLPTERAAAGCSYGAVPASCLVSPAGGQALVEDAVATINSLFEGE